jgi:hypothetical protein
MTLQEAILSGKKYFRRVPNFEFEDGTYDCYEAFNQATDSPARELYDLRIEDALAADWEVKP